MEISESVWAKAREAYHSAFNGNDSASSTEIYEAIARALMAERRECSEIVMKVASDIGSGVEKAGSYWTGVLDASIGISQAIRNK